MHKHIALHSYKNYKQKQNKQKCLRLKKLLKPNVKKYSCIHSTSLLHIVLLNLGGVRIFLQLSTFLQLLQQPTTCTSNFDNLV